MPSAHAIVVLIKVAWDEAVKSHEFSLRLTDDDGTSVVVPGPAGTQPMEFSGKLEAGRAAEVPAGSDVNMNFVIGVQPLPLATGQQYTWRLQIDGNEAAHEAFYVRRSTHDQAAAMLKAAGLAHKSSDS